MQATFMDDWVELRPDIHHDDAYFPEISAAGRMRAQIVHSAPDGGSLKIRLMYGLFVGGARKSLRIAKGSRRSRQSRRYGGGTARYAAVGRRRHRDGPKDRSGLPIDCAGGHFPQ
jgi:hypothetical protein